MDAAVRQIAATCTATAHLQPTKPYQTGKIRMYRAHHVVMAKVLCTKRRRIGNLIYLD